jgi:glutamate formiminotransferase/formiminotetrahydrofolate cyclodeaminase
MQRLVECVPNFSEGRKPEIVQEIARKIEETESAVVLDTHIDPDHNRSVITFVVEHDHAVDAAVNAVSAAARLIDLRQHGGEHPRIGATDVLPFVPLDGVSMEECISIAHATGERIASELAIPVYFYERAALRSDRANLEDVRRGGFERLSSEIVELPHRAPDVGRPQLHPSAGAIVVGARPFLIAYNINLRTDDIAIARKIAATVRGRDGGLRYLKALGFELRSRGIVQVSMNLTDFEKTRLHHAFEAVKREADRYGVPVIGSEIVGLIPRQAMEQAAEYFLQLENFSPGIVLEERIAASYSGKRDSQAATADNSKFGGDLDAPGGGSAAAEAAAIGASLGELVGRLTVGRDRFSDVQPEVQECLTTLSMLHENLRHAAKDDVVAFSRVVEARRLPQESDSERSERSRNIELVLKGAATVPSEVAALSVQVLEVLETLAEIGNPVSLSDAATGAQLALAAARSARFNVLVNTAEMDDENFRTEHRSRVDDLVERAQEIAARIEDLFLESVK